MMIEHEQKNEAGDKVLLQERIHNTQVAEILGLIEKLNTRKLEIVIHFIKTMI